MDDLQQEAAAALAEDVSAASLGRFETACKGCFDFKALDNDLLDVIFSKLFKSISVDYVDETVLVGSLSCLRILTRDKRNVAILGVEGRFNVLLDKLNFCFLSYERDPTASRTALEILKGISNIIYHGALYRTACTEADLSKLLTQTIRTRSLNSDSNVILFSLRVLFLLSAFEAKERQEMLHKLATLPALVSILDDVIKELDARTALDPAQHVTIAAEILKVMFNVTLACETKGSVQDLTPFKGMVEVLATILKKIDTLPTAPENLFGHTVNMLVNVPIVLVQELFDEKEEGDVKQCIVTGLRQCLDGSSGSSLEALFSSLACLSRGCPVLRRYLKKELLPSARDFHLRPEQQKNTKGALIKLMTDINHDIKEAAADFLFVLCKENVARLVKHTGYGNAAGLLASRGLLGGSKGEPSVTYSDDDDDSDTEEYIALQDQIDPITGAIKPAAGATYAQFTEEEKEEEAHKLISLIVKLNDLNVIKPMTIGADGKPTELDLSMLENTLKNK